MTNVFVLDMEVDYPDIFGIVTNLPPWKLCCLISRALNVELEHQDIAINAEKFIDVTVDNKIYSFEKYYLPTQSIEKVFYLIQNVIKIPISLSNNSSDSNGTLFDKEIPKITPIYLLKEWKQANFIIYIEELDFDFIAEKLKNIQGVQMVLRAPINKFKNYSKIL